MSDQYELITRNLQEVLGGEEIKQILATRPLKIYWGTATTGKPHIAYFLPILKIYDFLQAGCQVKILLADIHAFLDNMKAPFDLIENRSMYYEKLIKAMLQSLDITHDSIENDLAKCTIAQDETRNDKQNDTQNSSCSNLAFVKGSDYQLTKEYTLDLYKLSTITSEHDAKKAGAQVVKQVANPLLSSLIYPPMQALDEEYLDVDAQFGGVDQRKIFTYAMKHLPMLGYKKRIHLMNPMIPGLNSEKMSSSDEYSKIDMLDDEKTVQKKIRKCFCEEGDKENGIMHLMKHIVIPILQIKKIDIAIKRKDDCELVFTNYSDFEQAFVDKKIHPCDLKESVSYYLNLIMQPVRSVMESQIELLSKAYPAKQKFVKNKK